MELVHVAGNTYYLPGSTVVGVYIFPDRTCLLVDSAPHTHAAKENVNFLSEQGLKIIGIINTHAHSDHMGGNKFIQDHTKCAIYALPQEAVFVANPHLLAQMMYAAAPPRSLNNRAIVAEPSTVTDYIEPGFIEIQGQRFEILNLAGHSPEHCGVTTPDGVTFTGDALIAEEILSEYPFVFLHDLTSHLYTLEYLRTNLTTQVILAHGGWVKDIQQCREKNLQIITGNIAMYNTLLSNRAMSREEIIREMFRQFSIHPDTVRYYMTLSTVSAYLSHLNHQGIIRSYLQDGIMKFKSYPI